MGGMFVSVLANLVSVVANVVVHLTANEKMRYVCYRHLSPHLTSLHLSSPPIPSCWSPRLSTNECWRAAMWAW